MILPLHLQKHFMACNLMSALCCCRAGDALSQQDALAQQLREAEEMLGLAADEADSLDKVLQAVQATVQVLRPCTLHHCLWGRHTADTTFLLGWEELACLVCLLTK